MGRKQGPRLVLSFPPEFDAAVYRSRYADLADLRRSQLKEHWRQEGRRARRNAAPVDNRDDLLRCLQPAGHLLEIGPFDNPSLEPLRRPGLQIDYADHLSRAELVERARLRPERNPEAVPPIRYVLAEGGYGQIQQRYDAVVSHHCLEHQPDLIGHLLQVAQLLKPDGAYLFTLPDQRRCFDRHLPPSGLIDVVTAHLERRSRPPLQALVEHKCFTVTDWLKAPNPLDSVGPPTRALLEAALEEYQAHPYVDVHCWKFTNERFRRLVRQLVALAYLPASTSLRTYNLGNDFAVVLGFTPEP
jgi:SAM-dependent methyltransferase